MAQAPVIERKGVREIQWSYKILIHEVAYQVTGLTVKYLPFKELHIVKQPPAELV